MHFHLAFILISVAADSTLAYPNPTGGEESVWPLIRGAASIISAIAAAFATFFAYRSFSANQTKTKSDYYQRTVAVPGENRIDAFRKKVEHLLNAHEDKMQQLRSSKNTNVADIEARLEQTETSFREHIADLKYRLRSVAASTKNPALTGALIDAADRVETDVMGPVLETDKKLDEEVFDWRAPLTQSAGRLLSIIREHDPMLQE